MYCEQNIDLMRLKDEDTKDTEDKEIKEVKEVKKQKHCERWEMYSNPLGRLGLHARELCLSHPVTG